MWAVKSRATRLIYYSVKLFQGILRMSSSSGRTLDVFIKRGEVDDVTASINFNFLSTN